MQEQYDRALLLNEVWSEPLSVVAPRYGLSDVGLKKLCARLQIPTPSRGHWAKLKAGRPVTATPSLQAYTGLPVHLFRPEAAAMVASSRPTQSVELEDPRLQAILEYEKHPDHRIVVPESLRNPHALVVKTQEALANPYRDQRDFPRPHGEALDLRVSKAMQSRALRVADTLIKALEKRGYPVTVEKKVTHVGILGMQIELTFFESARRSKYAPTAQEMAKLARNQWVRIPDWQYHPTGILQVLVNEGYGGKVTDSARATVEEQLNQVICDIARRAVHYLVSRERQASAEAEHQRKREAAFAQKAIQDAERKRLLGLLKQAKQWQRACLLRHYLDEFEQTARRRGQLTPDQLEQLCWGRAKADWLDPFTDARDEWLDKVIEVPSRYSW
ncbi:hypothetical protein [Pseudomonas taiwanensis]|uniref:hypothetical protein n=1 Tax=Pseudomonas taiwanensis TaxID=470150 RepID=UPI0015BFF96C|nr:hypothetical protein [Pseudomonas taiwanensis]